MWGWLLVFGSLAWFVYYQISKLDWPDDGPLPGQPVTKKRGASPTDRQGHNVRKFRR